MRSLLCLSILVWLSACAPAPAEMAAFDPHQRFRTTVEARELVAVLTPGPDGLSAADRAVLRDLVREHQRRGAAPIAVSGGSEQAARLVAEALDGQSLSVTPAPGQDAVTVAVPVWVAVVPECGRWEEAVNSDPRNQNSWNFGCAVTRNMGLMLSDPADLVRARDASGRDGVRAADVLGKYGQGKATSSAAEEGAKASLSTVGK